MFQALQDYRYNIPDPSEFSGLPFAPLFCNFHRNFVKFHLLGKGGIASKLTNFSHKVSDFQILLRMQPASPRDLLLLEGLPAREHAGERALGVGLEDLKSKETNE